MKAKITPEQINDIQSIQGISITEDIEKALIDELSKNMEKEILNQIFKMGKYEKIKKRLKSIEKIINYNGRHSSC